MCRVYVSFLFINHTKKALLILTTGSVLGEIVNDESMVLPAGISVDIPVVLCSAERYLVWYST